MLWFAVISRKFSLASTMLCRHAVQPLMLPIPYSLAQITRVGQNHIYTVYIYVTFGWQILKYTIIYGVYIYGSGQP